MKQLRVFDDKGLVRAPLFVLASISIACSSTAEPADSVRSLPSATHAICSDGGSTQKVDVAPFEVGADRSFRSLSAPIGVSVSECDAAVRVEPGVESTFTLSLDRSRSLLAYGPGYLPTRNQLPLDRMAADADASLVAFALKEDVWRPLLPHFRDDAPTLLISIGHGRHSGTLCADDDVEVRVDAAAAIVTRLGAGFIAVDGLTAGAQPNVELVSRACRLSDARVLAPLENGVVTLRPVFVSAP